MLTDWQLVFIEQEEKEDNLGKWGKAYNQTSVNSWTQN